MVFVLSTVWVGFWVWFLGCLVLGAVWVGCYDCVGVGCCFLWFRCWDFLGVLASCGVDII